MKWPIVIQIPQRRRRSLAEVKERLYVRRAAMIQLAGLAWFTTLANDPSTIKAFTLKEWIVVALTSCVLIYIAALNARGAYLSDSQAAEKRAYHPDPLTSNPPIQ